MRIDSSKVLDLGIEVVEELDRATASHGCMASAHEGWAILKEEMDELWSHVKADTGGSPEARAEAIQIAAMAMRYVLDICS